MKRLPGEKQRILIVDDHPITREGMTKLLNGEPDLTICGEASSAEEALEAVSQVHPDLVITDLTLPGKDGLELIKDLKALQPDLTVLVVSMHDEAIYAERTLRAGARGFLMKQENSAKLLDAIRTVMAGNIFVSPYVSSRILENYSGTQPKDRKSAISKLSDREFEIFGLLGRGETTKQIANRLHISQKTVEAHRSNIKEKLHFATSGDLTIHAVRWVESERR